MAGPSMSRGPDKELGWKLDREYGDARYGALTRGDVKVLVQIEGEESDWTLEMWTQPLKKWLFQSAPGLVHYGTYPSKEAAFQAAKRIVQEMS